MDECYSCGITEDKATLYEGIHKSLGIVKVCRKCYFKERIPLIEKKDIDLEEINKRLSVRERLAKMAGLDKKEKKEEPKKYTFGPEDIGLKEVVIENFEKKIEEGPKEPKDLVDNFNWIIMRKRRSLKLSREELGEKIQEQAVVLEALEKGVLPRDYVGLIKKLENFLRVRLFKEDRKMSPEEILIESKVPSGILVSDVKKKVEEKRRRDFERALEEQMAESANLGEEKDELIDVDDLNLEKVKEIAGEPAESEDKKSDSSKSLNELSEDEINDLIFGRKG